MIVLLLSFSGYRGLACGMWLLRFRVILTFIPIRNRIFSHTISRFPLFLPIWENSFSHTPYQPVGNIKSNSSMSIDTWHHCFVKNRRHHAMYPGTLLWAFYKHKMIYLIIVSKIKNLLFVWGWERKNPSRGSPFGITRRASLVMPNDDPQDGYFTITPAN